MEDDLEEFRILLLLSPGLSQKERERAYQLSPIFVAGPSEFTELSTVVMNILLRNDEAIWNAPSLQEVVQ